MKIGELFVALGFDVDNKKLDGFNEGLNIGIGRLSKISIAASAALGAIGAIARGSSLAAAEVKNFGDVTGRSEEQLKRWQVVGQLTNVKTTAQDVTQSFYAISDAIAQIDEGGGVAGAFARLGVTNVRGQSIDQILDTMRDYIKYADHGLSAGQIKKLLNEAGVSDNLYQALMLTDKEFNKLSENKYISDDQVALLNKLGLANKNMRLEFGLMQDAISIKAAPSLLHLQESFSSLFGIIRIGLVDFEAFRRGLSSFSAGKLVDRTMLGFLNLFESEEGSKFGDLKRELEARGAGLSNMPARAFTKGGADHGMKGGFSPIDFSKMPPPNSGESKVEINSTFNIEHYGDAEGLEDILEQRDNRILSNVLDEKGNQPRF